VGREKHRIGGDESGNLHELISHHIYRQTIQILPVTMGLKSDLAGIVPDDLLRTLSDRFEVIGDVAILSIPHELDPFKKTIAATLLARRRNLYTVLNKVAKVSGDIRTARYETLAGETTVTLHREFGFEYRLDVGKTFFSSRFVYERKRVTDKVRSGERVLVPFCGVGPFAIPAAARGASVVAIEKNPVAFPWLTDNISLNKVNRNITAILGDAFDTSLLPHDDFDRAIIPTPYGMDAILDRIAPVVKSGGMIHFYTFKKRHQIPKLVEDFKRRGLLPLFYRSCGNVAPNVSRWVFDLTKGPAP
jgi:tRNA (guanine37-N1)-methyltransferase